MYQCESVLNKGDETTILSSGFDVRNDRLPGRVAGTPVNINGKPGAHEGEVILSWDAVPGAKAYNIQMSSDGVNSWVFFGTVTRRRLVITGLESSIKCFFRVAAIGPLGQSGWSDPAIGRTL